MTQTDYVPLNDVTLEEGYSDDEVELRLPRAAGKLLSWFPLTIRRLYLVGGVYEGIIAGPGTRGEVTTIYAGVIAISEFWGF